MKTTQTNNAAVSRKHSWFCVILLVTLPAGESLAQTANPAAEERQFVKFMFGLGLTASTLSDGLNQSAVQTVFQASLLNGGRLTTTGTLAVDAAGQLRYAPTPADRLVIANGGQQLEIRVAAFQGNFESADAFLQSHAALDFTMSAAGQMDLRVQSVNQPGRGFARRLNGVIMLEGVAVNLQIQIQPSTYADVNAGAQSWEYKNCTRVSGSAGVLGGTINLDTLSYYKNVNTVQEMRERNAASATRGNVRYAFDGVEIRKVFRDGRLTERDYWRASGALVRNGQVFGRVRFEEPSGPQAGNGPQAILQLADGTRIAR